MIIAIRTKCPYCQFEKRCIYQTQRPLFGYSPGLQMGYQIAYCLVNDGGCGNQFAINLTQSVNEQSQQAAIVYQAESFALVKAETRGKK